MNIHLAGIEAELSKGNQYSSVHKNFLITFEHFSRTKNSEVSIRQVKQMKDNFPGCKITLDSGAFSRASGVVDFELKDYIDFLHRSEDYFFSYITLDIPLPGDVSSEEIIFSKNQSDKNLQIMEKEGLSPIPVYQIKWDDLFILEKYLEKYEYICIGGSLRNFNDKNYRKYTILEKLDKIFNLNSKYNKRLHGLGQTEISFLERYPFYSVDSTSWKRAAGVNQIYTFINFNRSIKTLNKDLFSSLLSEPSLYDIGESLNYRKRANINILYYNRMQKYLKDLWKERGVEWSEYDKSKHFSN